jgi:uncharacterized damage-inducible protein DinB
MNHRLQAESIAPLTPQQFREPVSYSVGSVRAAWDKVRADMRAYLNDLNADLERPIDNGLLTWRILVHLLNHGTDHRAQLLAALAAAGVPAFPQDCAPFALGGGK